MGIYGGAYLSFILEEGSKFIYVGFRELMLCHWNNGIYGRMVRISHNSMHGVILCTVMDAKPMVLHP